MALSKYITEPQLMDMADQVTPEDMIRIGIHFLDLTMPQIRIFQAENREQVILTNFAILEAWRNKHDTPDSPEKLFNLLSKAAEKKLIGHDVFQFLKRGNKRVITSCVLSLAGLPPVNAQCHCEWTL